MPEDRVRDLELEVVRLQTLLVERDKALDLQAAEYKRRLDQLNHAHEKAIEVQHTYVTQEKYEDKLAAEEQARIQALDRVDEKFNDYVKRWEQRQREVDLLLSAQEGAAEEAKRSAEEQGRKNRDAIEAQARRASRNLVIVGLIITIVVGLANYLGTI